MPKPDSVHAPGQYLHPRDHDADWDGLPPNVKRKYFSSLERLRLAQTQTAPARPKSSKSSRHTTTSPASAPSKSLTPLLIRRNSSYFKNALTSRRKPASPVLQPPSPSDAQWFLRLPDKIQQQHFTREEREVLSGQTAAYIPDAADERVLRSFFQQGREANRSLPTLSTSGSSSISSKSTCAVEGGERAEQKMDDYAFDGFRWIENDDEVDLASTLQFEDYRPAVNKAVDASETQHKRRSSFRRTLSLTSLPFTSSHPITPPKTADSVSPEFVSTSISTVKKPARRLSLRRNHSQTLSAGTTNTITNLEPDAMHYNDPNARLKLRVYLASPQKFDEAIEFGFPSMKDSCAPSDKLMPGHRSRPSIKHMSTAAPGGTFLYDDTYSDASSAISFGVDDTADSSDTRSLPDRSLPYTPIDVSFSDTYLLSPTEAPSSINFHDPSDASIHSTTVVTGLVDTKPGSRDPPTITALDDPSTTTVSSLFPPPKIRHNYDASDPFVQALSGAGREMTLHMTLTRPDLRGDGTGAGVKAPYTVKKIGTLNGDSPNAPNGDTSADPLALRSLPPATDDIWDTLPLPKEGGKWKRAWRKVSGKGVC